MWSRLSCGRIVTVEVSRSWVPVRVAILSSVSSWLTDHETVGSRVVDTD